MSATHTPGPWAIRSGIVYGPNEQRVAAFEGLANARLIAAAPELLAALREVEGDSFHLDFNTGHSVCNFCVCRQDEGHDPDCTMQFVLAAIARAEGR
jgi:hypothetical protein